MKKDEIMEKQDAIKIFEDKKVRTIWDESQEKWFISIVDDSHPKWFLLFYLQIF